MATPHGQINRRIDDLRTFRVIHTEEEDVAPATVRKIHAHGRTFAQDRITVGAFDDGQQLGTDSQRYISRMPGTKHPLVAADCAHASAHLIRQRLKRQPMIGFPKCAGERNGWAISQQTRQKDVNSFRISAVEHVLIAAVRDASAFTADKLSRQMKAVNRIEEEETADAIIQVVAGSPILVELLTFHKQFVERQAEAGSVERSIADSDVGRNDNVEEVGHCIRDSHGVTGIAFGKHGRHNAGFARNPK